ncbi:MAG: hypothetical protein COB67_06465 [SAR324 cluster bacterium]|uniref:Polyprenyl synthetase family protein n=1 Tax=SAR324 cluster bacterium TaxID=2024889 RepID=A0A2A4T441_9DELT|nr:MAG: hypothetical protein COB67_06465 [SAR324 cluster bacterium]
MIHFKEFYSQKLSLFEKHLKDSFPEVPLPVAILEEAMKYSLFAGGKRIRPILLLTTLECAGKPPTIGLPFACALEYIHTYSLIHDDLPCMDDDHLRRGLPTSHIKFGEDIALLAGDALLTHSFSLLSGGVAQKHVRPDILIKIIHLLSNQAGLFGMITGQVGDIKKVQCSSPQESLDFIHRNKTGALITASIQIGALLAGVNEQSYQHLEKFGQEIGKCFQIQDDILDEVGNEEELGKPTGSDSKNEKLTYPSVFGLSESQRLATESFNQAIFSLEQSGLQTNRLKEIAEYILNRIH